MKIGDKFYLKTAGQIGKIFNITDKSIIMKVQNHRRGTYETYVISKSDFNNLTASAILNSSKVRENSNKV